MGIDTGISGLTELRAGFKKMKEAIVSRPVLEEVARTAKRRILERTASGAGIGGRPFKEYSDCYKKERHKKGSPADTVDLKVSGKMLESMTADVSAGAARLYFRGTRNAELAAFHDRAEGRRFFGVDEKDMAEMAGILEKHIDGVIKNAL